MATAPNSAGLSSVRVNKPLAAANRLLAALHAALAAAAIAHRAHLLLQAGAGGARDHLHHAALLAADLTLLFIWALSQAPMWRPVTRAAFPDRLRRSQLPGVDVLVVTADPEKEPTVEVMNTVVSAMALDYPAGGRSRLTVYLSDDAGSPLTLLAARKAYAFARAWVPFCRKYQVHCPCPSRYFAGDDDHRRGLPEEEKLRIKKMYETLTEDLEEAKKQHVDVSISGTKEDHDAYVEIIGDDDEADGDDENEEATSMPLLVYVSREKRKTCPHHFKAGALNVLLRMSGLVSNSPYVLVLDCDMNCNSRSSALEAMCFHLDGRLAFVQFPQMFRNLSSNDIYANELRSIFATRWKGLDGLRGPILSGTGFYARRDALYGATPDSSADQELCSMEAGELERRFGRSNDLVASVRSCLTNDPAASPTSRRRGQEEEEAIRQVVRCSYEEETGWGQEVGFLYQSVVEDYFTGYQQLFCRGWTSVYCYPSPSSRPAFLGSVPTNLNDVLVQNKRWMSGLLAVGVSSKHSPLLSISSSVSVLQSMSFAYYAFAALYAFPVLCYATLPQLGFFRGAAPLFPDELAAAAFAAVSVSSALQHLVEVSVAKRRLALGTWWNEQRFWMLNAVTAQLFACISVLLELVGVGTIDFEVTSKAADGRPYQNGVFDFTGCSTLLLPATTLSVLNVTALLGGIWNMINSRSQATAAFSSGDLLLPQLFLLSYVAALSYPLLEGMFLRQDAARVPPRITAVSVAAAVALLAMFG